MKDLNWGETPFDNLSPEDMLRELQRAYSALLSCRSALSMLRGHERTAYWSKEGTGGHAIAKADSVIEPVENEHGSEQIYRSFYRYADDLLFEDCGMRFNWDVCPKCGTMLGAGADGKRHTGQVCSEGFPGQAAKCDGVFRPLTWDDLAKKT